MYCYYLDKLKLLSVKLPDLGGQFVCSFKSNSKHTLLCLYGHNVLERTNLIPLKTLRWFAKWLEA